MLRATVLTLVLACALTACSGSEEPVGSDAVATPTASDTPTPGAAATELSFGDSASVSWAPRADLVGELSIRVDRVREGDFADFEGLAGSGIDKDNQPYYVDAVILNEGDTDFGGLDVPLYLADSSRTLSPPWGFATPFEPCDSGPLPTPFAGGDKSSMCLVFFAAPGAGLESITFQPTLESAPVTWTGDLTAKKKDRARKRRR